MIAPRIDSRFYEFSAVRLTFIPPMLPTLVDEPPEGAEWLHEIKFDGYRTQIIVQDGQARVFTRNGHDWTRKFQPIADAALELGVDTATIDGELIVLDGGGKPEFGALRMAIKGAPAELRFVAFDLLHLDGHDLRRMDLSERRQMLEGLIGDEHEPIRYSQSFEGEGAAFYKAVDGMGLEGIVSKLADSAYGSGRTRSWLKAKCYAEGTFDIVGVQRQPGQPAMVLMADGDRYMGGAFVTLPSGIRDRLWKRVEAKAGGTPPAGLKADKAEWIRPGLRGRVKYLKGEKTLRHASLLGIEEAPPSRAPGRSAPQS